MAESPPHVEVTSVGVKHDHGELAEGARATAPPRDAPRVPDQPPREQP